MTNLYKSVFLFLLSFSFFAIEAQGQIDADLIDGYESDSVDWVDNDVDYEYFKEIAGFGDLHAKSCEEPNIDINIGYYQRLFDIKLNYQDDSNCKSCQAEALYKILNEALNKGLSFDNLKRKIAQQDFLKLVSSDDNKLFSIQWNQGGADYLHYLLVHNVADGVYHVQNERLYYNDDFDNENASSLIDQIRKIKNTNRYIIYIANHKTETMCLFGVNLQDNVLKKEYMFGDGISCWDIKFPNSEQFAVRRDLLNLKGAELFYPVFDEENNACDGYLFYNGFKFTDIESYNQALACIEAKKGGTKIGRKYRILSKSSDWVEDSYSKTGLDFIIDRYTNFKTDEESVLQYRFYRSDLCPQLEGQEACALDSINLFLPLYEGRAQLDGLNSALLKEQLLSHCNPVKQSSPQPIYIAGYDEAFSYEKVKYTAVLFDREVESKDVGALLWAVEVDGKVLYLDKDKYKGMQISLDMNPRWEGKVIRVMPYIGKLDSHFYCETEVMPRY